MNIPKFWAQETVSARSPRGQGYRFATWGWSENSVEEARSRAVSRVGELVAKVQSGQKLNRYSYGERALREEIIRGVAGEKGEAAIVTRNAYGALVLNAPQAMFVDIDFQENSPLGGVIGQERKMLQDIQEWAARNPALGFRVYRTWGGLRGLVTNALFDPRSDAAHQVLTDLKSDALYIRLCHDQECFRARLSPKPWRCGISRPPARFPFSDARAELAFRGWEQKYNAAVARYGVCQFVRQFGSGEVHPEVARVLSVHDEATCLNPALPLA